MVFSPNSETSGPLGRVQHLGPGVTQNSIQTTARTLLSQTVAHHCFAPCWAIETRMFWIGLVSTPAACPDGPPLYQEAQQFTKHITRRSSDLDAFHLHHAHTQSAARDVAPLSHIIPLCRNRTISCLTVASYDEHHPCLMPGEGHPWLPSGSSML